MNILTASGATPPQQPAEGERIACDVVFITLMRASPPSESAALPLISSLRDAASSSLQLSFAAGHPRHEKSRLAASALCALLSANDEAATLINVQSTVSVSVRLLLPGSAEERARGAISFPRDTPTSRTLCGALATLLFKRRPAPAFAAEALLVQSRDLMRLASTASTISVARALLKAGAGRSMAALLPRCSGISSRRARYCVSCASVQSPRRAALPVWHAR